MKKIKLKEISRQFVINVFDDNLSLNYFKQSNQTVEDFFKMYNVEIRELNENETIYTVCIDCFRILKFILILNN